MFRLSQKALYAVEAFLYIAYNAGANPVQSLEITRHQGIPRRYIVDALQRWVLGGFLAGVCGRNGGYRLVRKGIRLEGLPVGISSRAAIAATLEISTRRKIIDMTIVAILPFCAEGYFSTIWFDGLY